MKICLFANSDWYLFNFRRTLIEHLMRLKFEVILISPDGPYVRKLQELGARWIFLDVSRRRVNPLKEFAAIVSLVCILSREKPRLIHNFTLKSVIYGSIAAKLLLIPRVNAIAGLGYVFSSNDLRARVLRPLVRILCRFSMSGQSGLIVQNREDLQSLFGRRDVNSERESLIPSSGIDCQAFEFPERVVRVSDLPLRVLFAARLLRSKGILEYLEAAERLQSLGHNIEFFVAGDIDDGNPDCIDKAALERLRSSSAVHWLGHVNNMAELLGRCDVMVLPSYYGEGLPRALAEGAAAGLALIATNVPGCRDAVVDGVTGFLVPPKNVAMLADALVRLCEDREATYWFGVAGRERARALYAAEVVNQATVGLYCSLDPEIDVNRAGLV